ncbi:glutamate synthase [Stylonychia lemnae]|uniref:Glutamate synthase n=1 Tax=Stylonychia lemnae TaxID=5949 RepID=A0A077ZUJ6_STYLE|nr:glutamate synthase [Stylonychia lemnae]|eukprot:CDW72141.1 glutamate synthase [Stylonychia lemnae]
MESSQRQEEPSAVILKEITKQMIEEGDFVTSMEQLQVTGKPKIARACPYRIKLLKGQSYLYCTCGQSKTQPFCDGKHKELDNGYKPLKVDIIKDQSNFLWCGCKRNRKEAGPNCDGNHTRIDDW